MEQIATTDLINKAIALSEEKGYIDVTKLAKLYGIQVFLSTNESEDFNACIEYDNKTGEYRILVNPTQPYERQRFSIAHELAHYILHKEKLDREGRLNRSPEDQVNKTEDNKADKLAAEILMPTVLVEKYSEENNISKTQQITKEIIEKIASVFKVSKTVAAIKLRDLKFYVPFTSFA